ncbi:MAG: hypothetical protein WEB63_12060 [Cucumibacter sp.]
MAHSAVAAAVANDPNGLHRRPIDRAHLARQTMGDRGLEIEILKMFDLQIRAQMAKLQSTSDSAERAMLLHSMKGSAFGVGARSIGQIALRAERRMQETGEVGGDLIADLEIAVGEASVFIGEILAS